MSELITFTEYSKNNLRYQANRKMLTGSSAGIIIYSTARKEITMAYDG